MTRKLIEVALPLDEINAAGAREKSVRHGHPSTLHLWWSRKPLAVARAVIFAQMVDDPSEYVDVLLSDPVTKRAAQRALRQRRGAGGQEEAAAAGDRHALRDMAAELERERLFRHPQGVGAVGEHHQRRRCSKRARDRGLAKLASGLRRARRSPARRRNCSTATRCPHSTIRSLAVALCRSKRNGWVLKRTPAI